MSRRFYDYMLRGDRKAMPSTVARLNLALKRYQLGYGAEAASLAPHAACKAALVLAAFILDTDPRPALAAEADPSGSGRAWRQTAPVRRLGMWIASNMLGFRVADVARAFGVTKQAVSTALREMEDDPALEPVRARLEEIFG